MTLPDFMIIGSMKCATSTLYEQLALQPNIMLSTPKEPNFFSNDEIYEKGMRWYGGLFGEVREGCLVGEASTHYTKLPTYPKTVGRILSHVPDAKFIYIMRHPIDRLVSHYIHEWSQNVIRCNINQALERHKELVDYSRYHYQLAPYIKSFGSNNVLPVFFDSMLAHPQKELERICKFIGYQGVPLWQDIQAQNISKERIRRFSCYDFLVDHPVMQWLRRTLIPSLLRDAVKSRLMLQQRPELNANSLEGLHKVFDQDLSMLGDQLGVHLNCENFKDIVKSRICEWNS